MLYSALCKSIGVTAFSRGLPVERLLLTVPADLEGAALLRWLLAQTYDIARDDADLRRAMPDGFDRLRRDYPQRRELAAVQIGNAVELSEESRVLCLALGCRTD